MADALPSSFVFAKNQVKEDEKNKQQSSCSVISTARQELRNEVNRISTEIEHVQDQITHCNQVIDTIDEQVHMTMHRRNKTFSRRLSRFFVDLGFLLGLSNSKYGQEEK
jgi:peptidoglycan hydrolase CwlO-like protein